MALHKESIPVPFVAGVDKATDSFTSARLNTLENYLFEKESATKSNLKRRPGFTSAISGVYTGTTALPNTGYQHLHRLGSEAVLETINGLYGLNLNDSKAILRNDKLNRLAPDLTEIRHTEKNQTEFDYAVSDDGNYACYIWVENIENGGIAVGQIYVMVKDTRTGQVLQLSKPETATSTLSCSGPRVVRMNGNGIFSVGSRFYCYYCRNNLGGGTADLQAFTISFTTPATMSAVNTVDAMYTAGTYNPPFDIAISNQWDATAADYGDRYIFAAYQSTAVLIKLTEIDPTDGYTVLASITRNIGVAALHITAHCTGVQAGIPSPADNVFHAVWHANGNLTVTSTDGNFAGTANNAVSTTAAAIGRATCYSVQGLGTVSCWFDVCAAAGVAAPTMTLQTLQFNVLGVVTAESQVVRSVGVGTRVWVDPNDGKKYMGVYLYSTSQPTFYVIELSATYSSLEVVARSSPSQCGKIVSMWARQNRVPATGANGPYNSASLIKNSMLLASTGEVVTSGMGGVGASDITATGIAQLDLYRDNVYAVCGPIGAVEMSGSLVFAGACPSMYDGQNVSELGFHYYPEQPTLGTAAAAGIGAGTRSYVLVYEWLDAQGKTHLSGVSVPVSITIAGGLNVTVAAPTLRLTRKQNVRISIFRTVDGGTIYYRISRSTTGLPELSNDPTVNTVTFTDSVTDANLLGGELLYTTGGVLENEPYPACKQITTFQDRLVFAAHERRHLLHYSEQASEFFFPGHSTFYSFLVPPAGGRVSGTQALDDNKLAVIQESSVGVVFGVGPNRLGLDNGYSEIQTNVKEIGCPWANGGAIIQDEFGVWFPTSFGMRHFNKGLALTMMPEGYPAGLEIGENMIPRKAIRAPKKTQLYFYCPDLGNIILVWDFANQQWSKITSNYGLQPISGVFVGDAHVWIPMGQAAIYKFSGTSDNANAITSTLETGWLKLSNLTGFQRLYAIQILGKYAASNTFQVKIFFDYDDTVWETHTTAAAVGAQSGRFQMECRPSKQKCEAFKIRIEEIGTTAGVSLTGMELLVGLKPGMFKIDSGKRIP